MSMHTFKWSIHLAVIFFIIAVSCIATSFLLNNNAEKLIGISTTFATLAGAILVFSTLEVQRKSLEEEISKNECSRFDSKFYPILSSFRMDAANMEITYDYIAIRGKKRGQGVRMSYNGDKAFFVARQIIYNLQKGIRDKSYRDFDSDELDYELKEIEKKKEYLDEYCTCMEDLNAIEDEEIACIQSYQISYLLYKYGITKKSVEDYKKMDNESLLILLYGKLLDYQPAMFSKYFQCLRFIIHIIDGLPMEIEKTDYYMNISCQLGKEELLFLKCLKEFEVITNNNCKY